MNKSLFLFLLLFFAISSSFSQILNESFETPWTPLPSGWYMEDLGGGSGGGTDIYWEQSTFTTFWTPSGYGEPSSPLAGNSAAWYNDYEAQEGQIDRLATFNLDLSATTNPVVSFFLYYQAGTVILKLVASDDGGTTWNDISDNLGSTGTQWKKFTFHLPEQYKVSNARIGFELIAAYGMNDLWLDSIVVFDAPPALTGVKTINNTLPTSGDNYNSFTDAFDALNTAGVGTGGVTFLVSESQVFSENPPVLNVVGTEDNQITFITSGTPGISNPVIEPQGSGDDDYAIMLYESSYVNFTAIDINCASTNFNSDFKLEYGFILSNNSSNNKILGCNINLSKSNSNFTYGITTLNGGNNNNSFIGNNISDCAGAFNLGDVSDVIYDENNSLISNDISNIGYNYSNPTFGIKINYQKNVDVSKNIIDGISSTTAPVYGIYCNNGYNVTSYIYENEITNLTHPSGELRYVAGMFMSYGNHNIYDNLIHSLSNHTGSCVGIDITAYGTSYLYDNTIYDLEYTGFSYYHAAGVFFGQGSLSSVYFYNNLIYDIHAPDAYTDADNYVSNAGIYLDQGKNFIYHNSVYIADTASNSNNKSAALFIRNHYTEIDIRNNIFINKAEGTFNKAAAFYHHSNDYTDILTISDNNLYYAGTPSASTPIFYNGTSSYQTITDYKNVAGTFDEFAITEDVAFLSSEPVYNLHIDPTVPTMVESAGAAITSPIVVDVDIDGNLRNEFTPDIGAFEGDYLIVDQTPPNISYDYIRSTHLTENYLLEDFAEITDASVVNVGVFKPRLYFKRHTEDDFFGDNLSAVNGWKFVESTDIDSPFSFEIDYSLLYNPLGPGTVNEGDIIEYFVAAQDLADPPNVGAEPSEGFSATSLDDITSSPDNPNFYFISNIYYDFEADNDQRFWHEANYGSSFDEWERGTPSGGDGYPETLPSGTKCWGTNIDGNYSNNSSYILYSPRFEATKDTVLFAFDEFLNIEPIPFDSVIVEYQVNNFLWYPFTAVYSRQDTAWSQRVMGLLNMDPGDDVIFRWTIFADNLTNYAGWYIDDFMIRGAEIMYYANFNVFDADSNIVAYPHIWIDEAPDQWYGNEDGTKSIPLTNGVHIYEVNGPQHDYASAIDTFTIADNDTNIYVYLMPKSYKITFDVSDISTGSPVENAEISVNSTTIYTDEYGLAEISGLSSGSYPYMVSFSGYHNFSETAVISDSDIIEYIELIPVGISEIDNIFSLYPNPVNDFLYVNSSENFENIKITISDIKGTDLIIENFNSDNCKIDISELVQGIYLISIDDGNNLFIKKIVKL